MTIKLPPREQRSGPIYQAIADAISREIETGRLKPGGRLPTQRVLARQLGVTLTTITRAYVEAQRRGLLSGEVGRGTFVRPSAMEIEGPEQGVLDLAVNALMPILTWRSSPIVLLRPFRDRRARGSLVISITQEPVTIEPQVRRGLAGRVSMRRLSALSSQEGASTRFCSL